MIQTITRTVYHAPTKGRSYLTKRAAIMNEAKALIERKHPTEKQYFEPEGYCSDPGWHWTDMPRHEVLLRRVCRLVAAAPAAGREA